MTEHNIAAVAPIVVAVLLVIIVHLSLELRMEMRRTDYWFDAFMKELGFPFSKTKCGDE